MERILNRDKYFWKHAKTNIPDIVSGNRLRHFSQYREKIYDREKYRGWRFNAVAKDYIIQIIKYRITRNNHPIIVQS